jgi:glycerol-3-phosphate acyltransferase PlsY
MPALVGQLLLIGLIGYLWGSIPAGYWMGKLLKGGNFDIRDYGSHKIGATNVLRTLGRVPAVIVFIFDLSKGILPTLLATLVPFFYGAGWGPPLAAFLALVGHCFPVFIGFKGGRGVSTGAGALVVLYFPTFLIGVIATAATIALCFTWLYCWKSGYNGLRCCFCPLRVDPYSCNALYVGRSCPGNSASL